MPAHHKLIVVEGIPGSGKTTMAAFIKEQLDEMHVPARLYPEGSLDHPADFESAAYFTRAEYQAFQERFSQYRPLMDQHVQVNGDDYFLPYRQINHSAGQELPSEWLAELARRDVYEIPAPATYRRLVRERWQAFARQAHAGRETFVFECCLLQNPLTVLVGKYNLAPMDAAGHIQTVMEDIRLLRPVLIYLSQSDPRAALERIAGERPQEWVDFVTAYFENGNWGRESGLRGFDCVIAFYEMRQVLELQILAGLDTPHLVVDQTARSYERRQGEVAAFLKTTLAGD